MGIIDSKKAYIAPQAKVVEVKIRGILCQSPDTGAATVDGYIEETLDW